MGCLQQIDLFSHLCSYGIVNRFFVVCSVFVIGQLGRVGDNGRGRGRMFVDDKRMWIIGSYFFLCFPYLIIPTLRIIGQATIKVIGSVVLTRFWQLALLK